MQNEEDESYVLSPSDRSIVEAAKALLWKILRSRLVDDSELRGIIEILYVLHRLPDPSEPLNARLDLAGPSRTYGDHRIGHSWSIAIEGHLIEVSAGGSFHRPETGSDSFTSLAWSAAPGYEAVLDDYTSRLWMVDDAMPFEEEVERIDLREKGFSLGVDYEQDADSEVGLEGAGGTEWDRRLEVEIDIETGLRLGMISCGAPDRCDLCGTSFEGERFYVDAALRDRSWANMCSECFWKVGAGIGWGRGQVFARRADGEWLCVAGFPPQDDEGE